MFECAELKEITNLKKMNFSILIVEDSRVINNLVTKNIQNAGYTCYQSYSLKEAQTILLENEISLIILDLHLPDGDGEELIFKMQELNKDAKIVIFTSDKDLARRDELFRLGILDYVLKGKNANIIIQDILNILYSLQINPDYTILIIDDSVVIRKMIKKILQSCGYTILEAKNAKEAFDIMNSNNIDLVLLDMEMPDMNGIEILKTMKEDEKKLHLPVFIISSNLDIEVMRNAYKAGALDYFKKPFSPEELKLKVEQVIKQKKNEQDLKCSIETSDICKSFLSEFYASAIFYSNSEKKWNDAKFTEIFGNNTNNIIQIFQRFGQTIVTDIIIAIKNNSVYKNLVVSDTNKKYILKLMPLKEKEFLITVESLDS